MALTVVTYPARVLSRPARKIRPADDVDLHGLNEQMADTMREYAGIGLAAPQVGRGIRFMLAHNAETGELRAFVNPRIVEVSEEKILASEGCLSFPGLYANVVRAERVVLRYQDLDFVEHEEELEGYYARVVQHEVDHLNGVLLSDRAEDGLHEVTVEDEESDEPSNGGESPGALTDTAIVPTPSTEAS